MFFRRVSARARITGDKVRWLSSASLVSGFLCPNFHSLLLIWLIEESQAAVRYVCVVGNSWRNK